VNAVAERPESPDLADIAAAPMTHSVDDLAATGAATFNGAHFRAVLGHFTTGITIVTGMDDNEPVGLTCQSFTSLSLEPPLVSFAPARSSTSWPRFRPSGSFCVNILGDDQEELCRVFATSGADKFRGVGWHPAETGSPLLDGVLAWVDCRTQDEYPAGDHLIVVGQVIDLAASRTGRPLLFYRGGYGRFEA
jgi:3-hydroxy-9,10-secoandrosta-1,3,5(10)-triene-9,17-dione monooxygenase reductase component